ncbi:MAG: hypothetical protein R2932_48680 [Caldilineaceae bacterium]
MADTVKVRGKNRAGKAVTLEKTQPMQMSLFQTFLTDEDKYSNTIELYDAIPKYYPSRQLNRQRENGKYLPILKRQFRYKNQVTGETTLYHVNIKPARIECKDGQVREFYPTEREELVEEALRKIAADNPNGVYLNDSAGVQFTLYQLRKELASRGHAIHLDNLLEALNICNEAIIEVKSEDGTDVLKSTILPVLLISSRKRMAQKPQRCALLRAVQPTGHPQHQPADLPAIRLCDLHAVQEPTGGGCISDYPIASFTPITAIPTTFWPAPLSVIAAWRRRSASGTAPPLLIRRLRS